MKWLTTSLVALILVTMARLAYSSEQMDYYQDHASVVVKNARQLFEPYMTPTEREVAQSIDYRVTTSPGVNAFATWEDNKRIVVIHGGTILAMDWILQAYLLEELYGHKGCFHDYVYYWAQHFIQNSEFHAKGGSPQQFYSPLLYSMSDGSSSGCKGVTKEQNINLGPLYAKIMEASIMTIYLHETGHHVLGHVKPKQSPTSMGKSRAQEDEADEWAIKTAIKSNYHLEIAVPAFALIDSTGGASLDAERGSDHPLGIRRHLKFYEIALDAAQREPEYYGANSKDAILNLEKAIDVLKPLVPEPEADTSN
jgi:hypothetical protein